MVEEKKGEEPGVSRRPLCRPPVDIHESTEGLTLRADIPGVIKETLELVIEDNILKIFGRTGALEPADGIPVYHEYRLGDFYRSFILSDEIDGENIKAEIEDGVLTLRLPKRHIRRRIELEVK